MTEVANIAAEAAKAAELSNAMVVGLGLGTVFVVLIALILLCYIMSAVCKALKKEDKVSKESAPIVPAASAANAPIANKQEVLAACCAVIAEELGTEANNIKVLSFKRV